MLKYHFQFDAQEPSDVISDEPLETNDISNSIPAKIDEFDEDVPILIRKRKRKYSPFGDDDNTVQTLKIRRPSFDLSMVIILHP